MLQVLDYLIRVHNTFIHSLKDADHPVVVPGSVTDDMLVRDVTAEFSEIVSMYQLTEDESALLPGAPAFLLDRIVASVRSSFVYTGVLTIFVVFVSCIQVYPLWFHLCVL